MLGKIIKNQNSALDVHGSFKVTVNGIKSYRAHIHAHPLYTFWKMCIK